MEPGDGNLSADKLVFKDSPAAGQRPQDYMSLSLAAKTSVPPDSWILTPGSFPDPPLAACPVLRELKPRWDR